MSLLNKLWGAPEAPKGQGEGLKHIAPEHFFGPVQMQGISSTVERATNVKVRSINDRA